MAGYAVLCLGLVANLARAGLLAGRAPGLDFRLLYHAASFGRSHGWAHIYDQTHAAFVAHTLDPSAVAMPLLGTPVAVGLVAPLTLLPESAAYGVWAAISLVLVVAAFAWTAPGIRALRVPYATAVAGLFTITYAIYLGQVSVVVIFALALTWRCLRSGREVLAGVALSLSLVKPHLALLVPVTLLASGRWRVSAAWAGAGLVLAAISVGMLGLGGARRYLELITGVSFGQSTYTMAALLDSRVALVGLQGLAAVLAVIAAHRGGRRRPEVAMVAGTVGSALVASYWHFADFAALNLAGALQLSAISSPAAAVIAATSALAGSSLITGLTLIPGVVQVGLWLALEWAWLVWLVWTGFRPPRQN